MSLRQIAALLNDQAVEPKGAKRNLGTFTFDIDEGDA
jgi:hypothetical protein